MKRLVILPLLLASLAGCAIFSTPGKVTSADATTEAGGVYGKVIQPANGYGCPSVVGQGAQTMGEMAATCTDHGAAQTIVLKAPDPNPALTTAYAGINQQMQTLQAMMSQMFQYAATLAGGPGAGAIAGGLTRPPPAKPPAVTVDTSAIPTTP